MPEICPSLFIIDPDKRTKPKDENDIFYPDGFKVLQAEKLTRIKDTISDTTTGQELQIRLLLCYRMKDLPETYCTHRHIETEKRICSKDLGIQNDFTYFHIHGRIKGLCCSEYFLAFIEGSDFYDNAEILAKELICSIDWLEIKSTEVFFNIFTFGEPIFVTSNESYLEEKINSDKVQNTGKHIEFKITHISKKCEDILFISLKDNYLYFNPSSKPRRILES
jgi:hypothetical protein